MNDGFGEKGRTRKEKERLRKERIREWIGKERKGMNE